MMITNNKVYDVLKWVATLILPAFTAFYAAIASTWGFPYTEQITASLAALNAFLGAIVGVSNISYKREEAKALAEANKE